MEIPLEYEVVFQCVIQNQAVLMAILRNMAQACFIALANRHMRDILIIEEYLSAVRLHQSGQRIDQLALSVAVNARDTDDFAPADIKGNVIDQRLVMLLALDRQILNRQDAFARLNRRLFHDELNFAPNHHLAQFFLAGRRHIHRADVLALAQNGAAVGNGLDFVELMRDEENGLAFLRQLLHDFHQLVDFLRRQNGSRLVKNQNLVVTIQHLEDFRPLLHADRDILHERIRIDLQPVTLAQLHDLLARLCFLQKAKRRHRRLNAENDVIQHRKDLDQLEVLMHHADAQRIGVVRVFNAYNLTIFANLALFRLIHAKEYAHQGRFARAVLAEQRMDFALPELQGDVIVGNNSRELLGNVQHLNNILAQSQSLLFANSVY